MSSSSALVELQAAYQAEIAAQIASTETLRLKQANYVLEQLIAAYTKQAELQVSTIQSHSAGGYSWTKRAIESQEKLIKDIEQKLHIMLYGYTTLADVNISGRITTEPE